MFVTAPTVTQLQTMRQAAVGFCRGWVLNIRRRLRSPRVQLPCQPLAVYRVGTQCCNALGAMDSVPIVH